MSLRRSLYEGYKQVHTRLCGVKTVGDFARTGTLTPHEFVDAGDELVLKVPVWQWVRCVTHRQEHLPHDKQCLVYRGAVCATRTYEDKPATTTARTTTRTTLAARDGATATESTRQTAAHDTTRSCVDEDVDGFVLLHDTREAAQRPVHHLDDDDDDEDEEADAAVAAAPVLTWDADASDTQSSHSDEAADAPRHEGERGDGGAAQCDNPHTTSVTANNDDNDDDDTEDDEERAPRTGARSGGAGGSSRNDNTQHTRYYDVYITYDVYYHTPRLYLVGYASDRVTPLTVDEMKQDVYHSNYDKTVTMDAHPVLGISCISIHPCRHAETMRRLMARMQSRRDVNNNSSSSTTLTRSSAGSDADTSAAAVFSHRMALFLFLKFISTVVPHIAYDVSAAVDI